jgi:hypothetical protein
MTLIVEEVMEDETPALISFHHQLYAAENAIDLQQNILSASTKTFVIDTIHARF